MTNHLVIIGTQNIDYYTNTANYNNITSSENISDTNSFIKVFITDDIVECDNSNYIIKTELKYKNRLENNPAVPKRKKYLKF